MFKLITKEWRTEKSPFRLGKLFSSMAWIFESTIKHSFLPILLCFITCDRIDRHPLLTCILDDNPLAACEPLIREYEKLKYFDEIYSCFNIACHQGKMDYIKFFLDNNYDVNYVDPLSKETALMSAAQGDQIEVFKLLLSKGADPRIRNEKNVDAVEFSPFFKHCEYEALVDLYAWEQYKTKAK